MAKMSEVFEIPNKKSVVRTALPPDVVSALRRMTTKINDGHQVSKKILSENDDNFDSDLLNELNNDLINKDE
jgi:hypothetical protein